MRPFPLVFVAALAGCHFGGTDSASRFPALETMKPFTAPGQLRGSYRVAGIDGTEFTSLNQAHQVTISDSLIAVPGDCTRNGWGYRFEGTALVTQAIEGPACRRAETAEEAALARALAGATKASPTPWHGIMIEGTGGTVTLAAD